MKSMAITFHAGTDAAKGGNRKLLGDAGGLSFYNPKAKPQCWAGMAGSHHIRGLVDAEVKAGRRTWANLCITIDGIPLQFWLPDQLDHVCDVFNEKPFPTAFTLAKRDSDELRLNGHWLSRLPKAAKTLKFRVRFVKYVDSAPKPLREFRAFYAGQSQVLRQS